VLSIETLVAFAPDAAYSQLLTEESPRAWWPLFARLATILLVIGVIVPLMAVQQVTIGLVATAAVSWSFVLAIQALVGASVILSAPARRVRALRALDMWFAGHLPYSLWMLVVAALMAGTTSAGLAFIVLSALVPAAWTAMIVSAFCRTVLDTTRTGARWRSAAHQIIVWAIGLTYVAWSAGGWFQIVRTTTRIAHLLP
jgi:hypothetical protein